MMGKGAKKNVANKKKGGAPRGNKNAVGNEGGAPTKYREEYALQAHKLCLLGSTDKDLADFFEVDERTINEWKKNHVEFSQSVKEAKKIADGDVAMSLYKRAKGCQVEETTYEKVLIDKGGSDDEDEIKVDVWKKKVVVKQIPPDPTSMIFWLKNRQKKEWRDKVEVGNTDNDGNDVKQVFIVNGKEIVF